jgi:hypothetical protein
MLKETVGTGSFESRTCAGAILGSTSPGCYVLPGLGDSLLDEVEHVFGIQQTYPSRYAAKPISLSVVAQLKASALGSYTPAQPDLRRGLSECSLRLFPGRVFPNCSIRTLDACS